MIDARIDCGHVETEKKERTADPATCTHPEVDSLGSTKTTARLTCTLCGTIVDEQPQDIKRDRARVAEAVKQSTSVDFDLRTSKVAVTALDTFKELVEEEYSSANTLTIHQLLAESLRQSLAAAGVATPQHPQGEDMVHTDKVVLTLPEVDTFASPDVWAVLDEGCNSTVHGKDWAQNAIPKLEALGYRSIFSVGAQKAPRKHS